MSRSLQTGAPFIAVGVFALLGCSSSEPFDPGRCKIEVETKLNSGLLGDSWKSSKETFLAFDFNSRGDEALLYDYLEQRGYFGVARAPDDPDRDRVRTFFPDRGPDAALKLDPSAAPKVACEASYVSGAKLLSVSLMDGMERVFEARLR